MREIPYLVVILNEQGDIVDFYSSIDAVGYTPEEVIGKNWFDIFIDPVDREKIFHVFQEIIAGNDRDFETYKNDITCKDGKHIFIDFYNKLVTKNNRRYTFSVGLEHLDYHPLLLRELGEYVYKNIDFDQY